MRDLGFDEVVGWSFTDPGEPGRLRIPADDERAGGVVLANPLSEDQSVMRTTVLGSLLDVAQRNLARGADAVALFESGRVYLPAAAKPRKPGLSAGNRDFDVLAGEFPGERPAPDREPHRIGCLAVGPLTAKSWRGGGEPADFFALKGVLEALAGQLGTTIACRAGRAAVPASRPLGDGQRRRRRRRLDRRAASLGLPGLGHRGGGRLRSRPGRPCRRVRRPARRPSRT